MPRNDKGSFPTPTERFKQQLAIAVAELEALRFKILITERHIKKLAKDLKDVQDSNGTSEEAVSLPESD